MFHHLPNGWFFSYFYPIRKYSKYSLHLIFCWERNDTSSLNKRMALIANFDKVELHTAEHVKIHYIYIYTEKRKLVWKWWS